MSRVEGPVLVVGAGLIGASVGLALTRAGGSAYLRDADPTAAHVAASRGAGVDTDPPDGVRLVVVATPPETIAGTVASALREFPDAVVTDVGSVKQRPLEQLRAAGVDAARYVGGHPMAGSERSGPLAAAGDLFEGRAWAVVARPDNAASAVAAVEDLARRCGAVVVRMSAEAHDAAVARISHLPHLMAALTAAQLAEAPADHLRLSGQGVRDMTRIAAGDPRLWREIVTANAAPLTELLSALRAGLDELLASLHEGDGDRVERILTSGVAGTQVIPAKHGGPPVELAVVTVAIPDEPGALARLFTDTGRAGVNVEDIRIDHDPGRAYGLADLHVLADAADGLVRALGDQGWSAHR